MLTRGYYEAGAGGLDPVAFAGIGAQFEAAGCLEAADPEACFKAAVAAGTIADPAGGPAAQIANLAAGCSQGHPLALGCSELLKKQIQAGLGCDTAAVEALYPAGLDCNCETMKCTPTGANGNGNGGMGGIPMWVYLAGAGYLGWMLWRRR